jgi:ATP-dependent DNA helicase 2 subunit 2
MLKNMKGTNRQRITAAKESIRMLLEQKVSLPCAKLTFFIKLLHNPKHEVGLVLFGTAETSNALNDQMGEDQYTNVTTERTLTQVDLEFFREIQNIKAEEVPQQKGDLLDGLIVGLDALIKFCGTRKYRKRVFMITDGEKEAKFSKGDIDPIVQTIKDNDIKLNCITIDFCNDLAEDDEDEEDEEEEEEDKQKEDVTMKRDNETENQSKNRKFFESLQEKTGCAIIPVNTAIDLYQQFKKKEYMARSKFRGNLEMAPDLNIGI